MADPRTETSLQAGLKKSTTQLFLATGAWVGSTALMSFGPSTFWDFDVAVTFLAIAANLIVGGLMLYSFFRHLKNMDELQRQTHLEAMALTLGITMVLTVIYGPSRKPRCSLAHNQPMSYLSSVSLTSCQ